MKPVSPATPLMARPSVLFVVPAWRRVELSRICFRQHAAMLAELRAGGIDAQEVVIADDENLDAAKDAGLLTLEHRNRLGAKWNAGYAYAGEHGFDYVAPLGSDSWRAPPTLPTKPRAILCTRSYTIISRDGTKQSRLQVRYEGGVGTRVIPTGMLKACGYQPLHKSRDRSCDTSTLRAIQKHYGHVEFEYVDRHPFEVVGFQSDVQVTPPHLWRLRWLTEDHQGDPFDGLAEHFPAELVDEMRGYYATR